MENPNEVAEAAGDMELALRRDEKGELSLRGLIMMAGGKLGVHLFTADAAALERVALERELAVKAGEMVAVDEPFAWSVLGASLVAATAELDRITERIRRIERGARFIRRARTA